ncbi:protein FAM174C [Aulostomus maculatus]
MSLPGVPLLLGRSCWLLLLLAATEDATEPPGGSTAAPGLAVTSPAGINATSSGEKNRRGVIISLNLDSSMIQRALYVLIGITAIGVLYFLIRAVRLKKPAQRKKYGLLANYDDSLELEAMESDEDDTLYEAHSLRR